MKEAVQKRADNRVSFGAAVRFWAKLGFISFGGPAGQIAIMHREAVEKRGWITENQFLRALNFCMLLPGPEAQQLATYIGWRLHGVRGGIAAGSLFVIPSIFVMLFLSYLAVAHVDIPAVAGAFYGVQPVVVAVVIEAVLRIGERSLRHPILYLFAAVSFILIFFFHVPYPWIVAATAFVGMLLQHWLPQVFCRGNFNFESRECLLPDEPIDAPSLRPSLLHVGKVALCCLLLWAMIVGPLVHWRGFQDVLVKQALFFTKAAFVTFGGAYAVLSYIADFAVSQTWLTPQQMLMGLGLAESTPGPLIMVTQYVGFVGAWKFHGEYPPLLYATMGAIITTYVTFLPCFFFIFAGSPYIEALAENRRLQSALIGVTAGVVGVVLNLAVYFGARVFFPEKSFIDFFAMGAAIISFVLLQRFNWPIHVLVPVGAVAGLLWRLL